MLDNFGLMEFLVLAFMAILFFGPERLPQMGARLGRWLSQLTQYSKAFMTQWSDEALAIQDAVTEVRGIREEIRAAQAEISGSFNTARQDITDTIDTAKAQIREAQPNPQALIDGQPPSLDTASTARRAAATAEKTGDDEAIEKTQAILANLKAQRETPQGAQDASDFALVESPGAAVKEQTPEASEIQPALVPADKVDLSALDTKEEKKTESAFDRTQRVLNNLMGKPVEEGVVGAQDTASMPDEEEKEPSAELSESEATLVPDDQTAPPPGAPPILAAATAQPLTGSDTPKPTSTAFDRTQRVLDKLLGKEVPDEEPEPVDAVEPESSAASAEMKRAPEAEQQDVVSEPSPPDVLQPERRFQEISVEVSMMRSELRALRQELHALEQEIRARAALDSPGDSAQGAAPMEEAA